MDYTIDIFVRHIWNDPRLAYNQSVAKSDKLILGPEFAKRIWMPDTFFVNGKDVKMHKTTTTEENVLLRISPNGDLLYSTRFTITASCPMDLHYFPMDHQVCPLEFASYDHTVQEIDYLWAEGFDSFGFSRGINLPSFELLGEKRSKRVKRLSTGQYTHLQLDLLFARSKGFYINQIYVPATLIIMISWIPLWLERDNSHARVALTITTVLTITTLITSTYEALPKISYVKAIDIYLFTCFIMVFASLLQSAIVEYLEAWHRKNPEDDEKRASSMLKEVRHRKYARIIDKASRVIFPLSFILFNIVYWFVYLNFGQHDPDDFNPRK